MRSPSGAEGRSSPMMRMDRKPLASLAALALLACLLLAAPATGIVEPPQVTDPAGDVAVLGGLPASPPTPLPSPLPSGRPSFDGIDLLEARLLDAAGSLEIRVATVAALPDDATLWVNFTVAKGPTSLPSSQATGKAVNLTWAGSVAGVTGATATRNGTTLAIRIPLQALGAVGGDVIGNLSLATRRIDAGAVPDPGAQDDATGRDRAPDQGTGRAYTLTRPAAVGGASLTLKAAKAAVAGEPEVTYDGTTLRAAAGQQVLLEVELANTGTDPDTLTVIDTSQGVRLADAGPDAYTPLPPPRSLGQALALPPGATHTLLLGFTAPANASAAWQIGLKATGASGASATLTVPLAVVVAPPPAGHQATPASLGFLTPLAEGLGLVSLLGDHAELFLLALLVLLAILTVFLAWSVHRGPPVPVLDAKPVLRPGKRAPGPASPKVLDYGEGLELEVTGRPSKDWEDVPAEPTARQSAAAMAGKGRVWPPLTELEGQPENEEGHAAGSAPDVSSALAAAPPPAPAPAHAAPSRAPDTGRPAAAPAAPRTLPAREPTWLGPGTGVATASAPRPPDAGAAPLRIAQVRHEPPMPRAGQAVSTTATVQNLSSEAVPVRVVLLVDERVVAQQTLEVPPAAATAVVLQWTAMAGRNQVRVKVSPA